MGPGAPGDGQLVSDVTVPLGPWAMRQWSNNRAKPLPCWGGDTLSRGSAGEYGSISPLFPSILPRWPPCKGFSVGTSQESWENSILDIRVVLHGYL